MRKQFFKSIWVRAALAAVAGLVNLDVAQSADDEKKPIQAPPKHAIVGETLAGWYFAPKELKKEYDNSLKRLESLQADVDAGTVDSKEAAKQLGELRTKLKELRSSIEDSRVHVQGAEIHEQTETIEFELGAEKRLAITANQVRVVGWDKPNVRIDLKKRVLSTDGKSVDDQLKAIAIVHKYGRAEFAGRTDAEWDTEEAKYLATDGAKLTPEQREDRRKFVDEIRSSYTLYRDLVGKEIDHVSVSGLDYQDNKSISLQVNSNEGEGQWGSVRQRYAEVTAYVPQCTSVTVRGARRGLTVENLTTTDLILTSDGNTDSDARGRFEVEGLKGNLICRNFPLRKISKVTGDVSVESTTEFGVEGAGTMHHDGFRNMTPARQFAVQIDEISGNVDLRYGRVKLDLSNVGGAINVVNEFGDTNLVAQKPLSEAAHRIYSECGRIDALLSANAWKSVPVVAVTNHGGVRTNVAREEFDDFHLEGSEKNDKIRRDWSGFRTREADEGPLGVFNLLERFGAITQGGERSKGIDLFTRNGRIAILRK
jgi:hypothetical protein